MKKKYREGSVVELTQQVKKTTTDERKAKKRAVALLLTEAQEAVASDFGCAPCDKKNA